MACLDSFPPPGSGAAHYHPNYWTPSTTPSAPPSHSSTPTYRPHRTPHAVAAGIHGPAAGIRRAPPLPLTQECAEFPRSARLGPQRIRSRPRRLTHLRPRSGEDDVPEKSECPGTCKPSTVLYARRTCSLRRTSNRPPRRLDIASKIFSGTRQLGWDPLLRAASGWHSNRAESGGIVVRAEFPGRMLPAPAGRRRQPADAETETRIRA